jgi:hypothetical protein
MKRKTLVVAACLALSSFLLVDQAFAGEPVNLSRYSTFLGAEGFFAIPAAITDAFCRDAEGCEAILTLTYDPDSASNSKAKRTRLMLSLTNGVWFTTDGAAETDGAGGSAAMLSVMSPSATMCIFHEGETGGADTGPGFGLWNYTGGNSDNHRCRLVLID